MRRVAPRWRRPVTGSPPLHGNDLVIERAAAILVLTVGLLTVAAEASGRHTPGVEEQVVRLWLEGWSTIRRRLLILACVVAVLLPQGGVLQALLDPRPGLGDSGRALLVANLIVAVAWAVFLVALRPRDRGAG